MDGRLNYCLCCPRVRPDGLRFCATHRSARNAWLSVTSSRQRSSVALSLLAPLREIDEKLDQIADEILDLLALHDGSRDLRESAESLWRAWAREVRTRIKSLE